ncbi:TetR/AcrR family transcriptional regulator [Streptomyces sp. NPDC046727]|uniref:TetR/AcrR family transcriptional regulator n=1 Tax=Streptomyces sp. NPDC046727 TaxID=3155373 RepID=UPI0033D2E473
MQGRAARTREELIRGAAVCMDAQGYRGATLTAISKLCNVSIGALTFHFPDKTSLAAAVVQAGAAAVREAVEAASEEDDSPLRAVGALLRTLARLLEEDVVVRATALLARERADIADDWHEAWMPRLAELAEQADARGELDAGGGPQLVVALAGWLLVAAEAYPRTRPGRRAGIGAELARVWPLIERGVAGRAV